MATVNSIIFPENATTVDAPYSRYAPIMTPAGLKARYLHAVDLRDNDGNDLPDEILQEYINIAISEAEHELDLPLWPTTYLERKDYVLADYNNWVFLQLNHYPAIRVDKIEIKYRFAAAPIFTIPDEWVRLSHKIGTVRLTPTSATITSFNIPGSLFLPQVVGFGKHFPHWFEVTYTAGFEEDKVPYMVNHYIALKAAVNALDIAGDIIIGAGIASQSISLDSLNQSIGTTSSSTNAGYGARIIRYQGELERLGESIKKHYKRYPKLTVA